MSIRVERVSAETVRPLRTEILRPGWTDRLATYPEDETVAVHVAALRDDTPHGVGTIYAEAPPSSLSGEIAGWAYAPGASWRLRGMATSDEARGAGLGRAVLNECFEVVRQSGGRALWCNARIGALAFYQRMGLVTAGPEFEMPEIGPHFVMWREV